MLGRHGVVRLFMNISGNLQLNALERDGSVLGRIPFRKSADGISFTADTFRFPGKVIFAYELKRI